ncbi:HAD family hydrolase [Enterococcus camelliae]|uniref:HAD family hydrolase n=1 Tax=Enterococcus camelliae TaxID=453959 RepID=A0ABW5THL9_9ENTE
MDVFAIDLDGTLLTDDKEIAVENVKAIQYAAQKGATTIIVTGRSLESALGYFQCLEVPGFVIALNGAVIANARGQIMFKKEIDFFAMKQMINLGIKSHSTIWLNNEVTNYQLIDSSLCKDQVKQQKPMTRYQQIHENEIDEIFETQGVLKIALKNAKQDTLERIRTNLDHCKATLVKSDTEYLEMMAETISKGESLHYLLSLVGMNEATIIAFGDQENDLSLFQQATIKFAMGNAIEQVKKVSSAILPSNNDAGVSQGIYRYYASKMH